VVLVTGAGGPLGVNVSRALRQAPRPPTLVGTDANRWHLPLSVCDRTYRIPAARDRDRYARALAEIAAREAVEVLIPTHPVEVRAVAELRDAGRLGDLKTALPATAVLAICDDKAVTQRRLRAAGVAVPETVLLERPEDVEAAFARWGAAGPVWIRGSGAPGLGIGGAALPCRDPGVGRAWVEHHQGWGRMAASEYLPGANLSWMAIFAHGALLAAGCRERLEYVLPHVAPSGVTGAPAVSRTVDRPDVAGIGEAAVRAVDPAPHGAYFVDLKADAAEQPRVTEINAGRCGTTVLAYLAAGVNLPWMLAQMAAGEPLAPSGDPHRAVEPDVYWVRTLDCGPAVVRGDAGFDAYPDAGFD
jgi:hypothetical protein